MSLVSREFQYFVRKYGPKLKLPSGSARDKASEEALLLKVYNQLNESERSLIAKEAASAAAPPVKKAVKTRASMAPAQKVSAPRTLTNFAIFLKMHGKDYPFTQFSGTHREKFAARAKAVSATFKALTQEQIEEMKQKAAAAGLDKTSGLRSTRKPRGLSNFAIFLKIHGKDYPFTQFSGTHREKVTARAKAMSATFKALTQEQIEEMKQKAAAAGLDKTSVVEKSPKKKKKQSTKKTTTSLRTKTTKSRTLTSFCVFLKMHGKYYPISQFEGSTHNEKFAARAKAVTAAYKALTPKQIEEMKEKAAAAGLDKSVPKTVPLKARKSQALSNFALFLKMHSKDYRLSEFDGTYKEKFSARSKAVTAAYKALTPKQIDEMRKKAVAQGIDRSTSKDVSPKPRSERKKVKLSPFAVFLKVHGKEYPFSQFSGTHPEKFAARAKAVSAAYKALTPEQKEEMREKYYKQQQDSS